MNADATPRARRLVPPLDALEWGDEQFASFCAWLPRCARLEQVQLGANDLTDAALATLAEAVAQPGVLPQLDNLMLHWNKFTKAGPSPLARAMEGGALPALKDVTLGGGKDNEDMQRVKASRKGLKVRRVG